MIRRSLAALALLLLWPTLALAQDAATPPAPLPRVVMETSAGRIVIEVNDRQAPITGGNFLRYVDEHRFDGTSFYRAVRAAPDLGLVQGGTNNDPAKTLPPIAHEPTTVTGLSHVDGAVSMARYDAGTATGDFFVSVGSTPSYDAGRPIRSMSMASPSSARWSRGWRSCAASWSPRPHRPRATASCAARCWSRASPSSRRGARPGRQTEGREGFPQQACCAVTEPC